MNKQVLTFERLRELLHYDPNSGIFTWLESVAYHVNVGDVAGTISKETGYRTITIYYTPYRAHRLAWFYATGNWPTGQLDHLNGSRDDNRIANLREATSLVNSQNMRKAQINNKSSGLLGAYRKRNKWLAQIMVNGKQTYVGVYDTQELAHAAYVEAKRRLHIGCTI